MRISKAIQLVTASLFVFVIWASVASASPELEEGAALGVEVRPLEWKPANRNVTYRIFEVLGVKAGSAAQGLLMHGDVIHYLDKQPFQSIEAFLSYIASHRPGNKITVTYVRSRGNNSDDLPETDVPIALVSKADVAGAIRTPCDDLGSHPEDAERVAPGVDWERLDGYRASVACEEALRSYSHSRLFYQHGRALYKMGRMQAALVPLWHAFESGHVQASFAISAIREEKPDLVSDCELREVTEFQIERAPRSSQSHINRAIVLVKGYCGPQNLIETNRHVELANRYAATDEERRKAREFRSLINTYMTLGTLKSLFGGGDGSSAPRKIPCGWKGELDKPSCYSVPPEQRAY
jgi:hypothetical protein